MLELEGGACFLLLLVYLTKHTEYSVAERIFRSA
jgi:hypothetical protein